MEICISVVFKHRSYRVVIAFMISIEESEITKVLFFWNK